MRKSKYQFCGYPNSEVYGTSIGKDLILDCGYDSDEHFMRYLNCDMEETRCIKKENQYPDRDCVDIISDLSSIGVYNKPKEFTIDPFKNMNEFPELVSFGFPNKYRTVYSYSSCKYDVSIWKNNQINLIYIVSIDEKIDTYMIDGDFTYQMGDDRTISFKYGNHVVISNIGDVFSTVVVKDRPLTEKEEKEEIDKEKAILIENDKEISKIINKLPNGDYEILDNEKCFDFLDMGEHDIENSLAEALEYKNINTLIYLMKKSGMVPEEWFDELMMLGDTGLMKIYFEEYMNCKEFFNIQVTLK